MDLVTLALSKKYTDDAVSGTGSFIRTSEKGAANGVAELDSNGLVPTSQLPSYVDDVLDGTAQGVSQTGAGTYSATGFILTGESSPTTPEEGKTYVDTTTNIQYRWSGSVYVSMGSNLTLGETQYSAYRGDRGKTAYGHATDENRLTTATKSGLYKVASTSEGHIASLTPVEKEDITDLGIPAQDTVYDDTSLTQRIADTETNVSALDDRIDVLEDSNSLNDIASISDSTAPLTLTNSKRGGFNLTDVGGKWEQFTTTGKNLLPMTLAGIKAVNTYGTWNGNNYTLNGVTFDMLTDDDGNVTGIKANGTASNNVFFNLCANITLPGGTYTISGDSDNEHIISNLYIQSVNTTPIVVYQAVETFTLNESTEFGVLLAVFDGKTVANQMFYPMLELGSRATTYEPYTGGIPAPNPDYPQSVNPVEIGEITEHGFNWWDEEWELGSIDGNGQNTSTSTEIRTKNYIPIIAGASYYVKQTGVQVFHFYNANYGYLGNEYISDSRILIIPADTKYMKFRCANTYGTVYKNDICINISDAALNGTYEPYHSATQQLSNPITLYGNGDVKDEIVRLDDGSLKVLRKYGQVDLGVLSWQFATNYFAVNKDHIRNATGRDIRRDMDGMLSCSFYRYMPGISGDHRLYQTSNAIRIRDDSYTDVTTFKASLDGVMLYYELAEPYYEDIPVVDQIALNSLETFDTVTYVDFNSDVEPTVSGEYGVSKLGGYALESSLKATSLEQQLPKVAEGKVYGMRIDGDESDPASMITYLADAVGMTPVHMDYTNDTFDYGSWKDVIKNIRPCVLNADGTVYCYLDPDDFTKDIDGNDVTNIVNGTTDFDQNVMIEFSKFWLKIVPYNNGKSAYVYIADYQVNSTYKDYAYIDKYSNHKDHFYMPAFNGSLVNGVMRSLMGKAVSKTLTAQQEINACVANGAGWYTEDAGEIMLINMLLLLIGKSTDTQNVFGKGLSEGGSEAINNGFATGVHSAKGMFYGTNSGTASTYTNAVKVFGIENWWGFQWRRYAGDILDNGTLKVKMCWGTEDGSTVNDFNLTGEGYVTIPDCIPSGASGGYISEVKATTLGMFAKVASGSATTYYTDGYWFYNNDVRYAFRGGFSGVGLLCGALCVYRSVDVGYAYWDLGAAISYK